MRRLLTQAKPYRVHVIGIFLIGLLAAPLAILMPVSMKISVDNVIGSDPLPNIVQIFLQIFLLNQKCHYFGLQSLFKFFLCL